MSQGKNRSSSQEKKVYILSRGVRLVHIETGKSTKNLMASYLHNNGKGQESFYQLFVLQSKAGTALAAPTNFYVAGDMA